MSKFIWIIFLPMILNACVQLNVINHDEVLAAQVAKNFAEAAFVKQDYVNAYSLLSDKAKKEISSDKFKKIIIDMHPLTYPMKIAAIGYDPVLGQKAINIFIIGAEGKERFYYRLFLNGTKENGYKTAGFFRIKKMFSASNLYREFKSPI